MSDFDFTKIRWAGMDCILITEREHNQEPVAVLTKQDIKRINKEMLVKA